MTAIAPLVLLNSLIAAALDTVATLAVKAGLIGGAHVHYVPGRAWGVDAWKEGGSWRLQLGGFEGVFDPR